jgi:hypothetical protein
MATATSTRITNEYDVLRRLLNQGKPAMTASLARHILKLGFTVDEQDRMEDLAARNQESKLSDDEHQELMSYVRAGHILALLQSQARRQLNKKRVS